MLCAGVRLATGAAVVAAAHSAGGLAPAFGLLRPGFACGIAGGVRSVSYKGYHFRGKGSIRDSRFMGDVLRFSPLDVYYNGQRARKSVRDMKRNYAGVERMPQKYRYLDQKDDLLMVFVIGESTRATVFRSTVTRATPIRSLPPFPIFTALKMPNLATR